MKQRRRAGSSAFYGLIDAQPGSIPVYQYHSMGGNQRFLYSTQLDIHSGWTGDGVAFYAHPEPGEDRIPVYQYHAVNADHSGWRFFYATDPNLGSGWAMDGVAFYAPSSS